MTMFLALALSCTMALTGDRTLKERVYRAVYLLICSLTLVIGGSWMMSLIEG
jgi:hypothetical protein